MRTTFEGYSSPDAVLKIQRAYVLVAAVAYFVLVWDWASNLANEWRLVVKPGTESRRRLSLSHLFLLSRYVTLLWCTFVIATTAIYTNHSAVCGWFPYYTYGYSVVSLFAHLVMVLRVHSIYDRRPKVLYSMLALAIVDFAVQMSANHWVTSVLLNVQVPRIAICFILPTSMGFALVFISPTVFHHLILVMTLLRSIKHIRITKAVGIGSIMEIIQRDHIFYVLAICLINFTNLVLVLQGSDWPYGLVNQFPAAAFTQIFLSRIVFSLRHTQLKLSSGATSGVADLSMSPTLKFGLSSGTNDKGGEAGDDSAFWDSSDNKSLRKPSDMSGMTLADKHTLEEEYMHIKASPGRFSTSSKRSKRSPGLDVKSDISEAYALSSYKLPSPKVGGTAGASPMARDVYHLPSFPSPTSAITPSSQEDDTLRGQSSGLYGLGVSRDSTSKEEEGGGEDYDNVSLNYYSTTQGPVAVPDKRERMDSDATLLSPRATAKANFDMPLGEEDAVPALRESTHSHSRPTQVKRRTIDEEQLESDWDPPTAWHSPSSPRASPIPYNERRLSESIHIVTPPRGNSSSSSSASRPNQAGRRNNSVGYASLFSFDEEVQVEQEEKEKKGGA